MANALSLAAAFMLLGPASPPCAHAQSAQPAASQSSSQQVARSDQPKASATQTTGVATGASAPFSDPSQPQSVAARAIDKMKAVAKSAGDIFSRVPCLPPKSGADSLGSLPHVARRLVSGDPVVIVALGSSSTTGFGSSSPEYAYPNRLAAQLRRHYPTADITIINAGVGGEDAPEMMRRLQSSVLDRHPDLVIWQVGTNAVLRNLDPAETVGLVDEGVARIQAAGSDVVLVDPQYSPRVTEHSESAGRIVTLLRRVAQLHHVGIFPRFQVMRDWHEKQDLPIDSFVIADGLHMNDWGYACFAQLLGDDIIRSVGQIRLGVNVPAAVLTYRPM